MAAQLVPRQSAPPQPEPHTTLGALLLHRAIVHAGSRQLVPQTVHALADAFHTSPQTTGPPADVGDPHRIVSDHALTFGIKRPPPTRWFAQMICPLQVASVG